MMAAQRAAVVPKAKKETRARWHFGIRSRSPPMEVMHEIYKTLQTLGMEWKKKPGFTGPWDEYGRPVESAEKAHAAKDLSSAVRKEKKQKEKQQEEKYSQGLFFVETRCRIGDVVVSAEC
jgi:carbon catabolite-derepressing protein kinase